MVRLLALLAIGASLLAGCFEDDTRGDVDAAPISIDATPIDDESIDAAVDDASLPPGTCPCAAQYDLVAFSTTPICRDQGPSFDNQLVLETPASTERLLSRFIDGSVTNLCQARDEVGDTLFFNQEILNEADADVCRTLVFARAAALGVTCD